MVREYLAHIFISVDSNVDLNDDMITKATREFEESLSGKVIQDDIADSIECSCTLWEEV